MNSAEHRNWNLKRRLGAAFIGPTLLLLSSICSAQTTIIATPNTITDAAKPPLVTLTIKKDGVTDTALTGQVGKVNVGGTPVVVTPDTQGNPTFTPPENLSGVQKVQLFDKADKPLLDSESKPLGIQLTYPSGDGQNTNQTGTQTSNIEDQKDITDQRLRLLNEEDRRKKIFGHGGFYLLYVLVALPLIAVLGLFASTIRRAIRFSRSTFNNPLGLPVGSFRAMVAFTLVASLATYILASVLTISNFSPPDFLLGIVATVIGFYFGSRSGEEGVAEPKAGTVRGIVRKDGSPASGALVKFKRADDTEPYSRITDLDGRFELRGARPGKYKVSAALTGVPASAEQEVTAAEGSDHEIEIVIKSAPTGTVQGTVMKADGTTPAAGSTVELSQTSGKKVTKTADATGKYKFDSVPAGDYDIQASLTGNGPSSLEKVKVTADATQTVNLKLA